MARDAMSGETLTPDLCVIGAGSGGLSVAAGAAQMGARVVLVEGAEMGGDCLNHGCVPSKALIAAGKRAHAMTAGAAFGVAPVAPTVDFARVMAHVRETIAAIAPHDSQERFEGLGVRVIRDWGAFTDPDTVMAGGTAIRARRFVIATGSRPALPPVAGLAETPHLTNETVFGLDALPRRLIALGGGPIGCELAQAFRRLGAEVVVIEAARALGREDPEAAAVVLERLRAEGVEIREGVAAARAEPTAGGVRLTLADDAAVEGSHLLVAAGRRPALERLDLAAGRVAATPQGVSVDRGLRSTTNRRVYAVGDAAGQGQLTHLAGYHASLVIRSALFRLPVRTRAEIVPRATYTDPELAQAGLTEAEARAAHGARVSVARADLSGNDRARAEREIAGFVKLMVGPGGRILGATAVGPQAGETIQIAALAIASGLKAGALAGMVAPYPTLGEAVKRAAGAHFAPRLFGNPWLRGAIGLLARFG